MPTLRNLYYTVSESGSSFSPPLVLIHGEGASLMDWPVELRHLPGCNVYSLDLPGHGRSPAAGAYSIFTCAERVAEWMEALDLPPAVVIGHSLGGAVAMALALEHSARVAALLLVGASAAPRICGDLIDFSANSLTLPVAVETLVERGFGGFAPSYLIEQAVLRLMQTAPGILHQDLLACDAFDVREQLWRIHQHVLIAAGSSDRLTPAACSALLAARLPNARLRVFYGAGHLLMLEQPAALAYAMHTFLEEIAVREGNQGI